MSVAQPIRMWASSGEGVGLLYVADRRVEQGQVVREPGEDAAGRELVADPRHVPVLRVPAGLPGVP